MTKTTDHRDQVLYQCARGQRTRNVNSVTIILAEDRNDNVAPGRLMADAIVGETEVFPIFCAPCAGRILRIYANGTPYADMGAGETAVATTYKSAATALGAGITIGDATVPTANTAIDDVLVGGTTSDFTEGQHIYTSVAVDSGTLVAVAYVTINVEWVSTEQ